MTSAVRLRISMVYLGASSIHMFLGRPTASHFSILILHTASPIVAVTAISPSHGAPVATLMLHTSVDRVSTSVCNRGHHLILYTGLRQPSHLLKQHSGMLVQVAPGASLAAIGCQPIGESLALRIGIFPSFSLLLIHSSCAFVFRLQNSKLCLPLF